MGVVTLPAEPRLEEYFLSYVVLLSEVFGEEMESGLDESVFVNEDLIKIVSSAASDRWLEFGRVLLRKTTKDVTNIAATLASPNPLSPKDKLVKILEEWIYNSRKPEDERDERAKPASREVLKKACRDEGILGGLDRLITSKYMRGKRQDTGYTLS